MHINSLSQPAATLGRNSKLSQTALSPGRANPVRIATLMLCLAAASTLSVAQAQNTRGGGANAGSTAANPVAAPAAVHPSRAAWVDVRNVPSVSATGAKRAVDANRLRTVTLDKNVLAGALANAPMEFTDAAKRSPAVLSLPSPDGGFQRFAVVESPIMEAGLAARHPHIKTYSGHGIDDPKATIRVSLTQMGLKASVRAPSGAWYIDPLFRNDTTVYASYNRRDLVKPSTPFVEGLLNEAQLTLDRGSFRSADKVNVRGVGFAPGSLVSITVKASGDFAPRQVVHGTAGDDGTLSVSLTADPFRSKGSYVLSASDGRSSAETTYRVVADGASLTSETGPVLRTYRLALLSDPAYSNFFGGAANTTAAKVEMLNRVNQIYEDETAIRMILIANNDVLNLDTPAQFSQPNGPCGGTACFPTASVGCSGATLTRNRLVLGMLVGASAFDVGHIGVGAGGGGVASLGSVGGNSKAQGCTGLPQPVGDVFAVDYVAHEIGHQFAGNHTFNGVVSSCSGGNRSAANSVEPGAGSSIMAYAGICGSDNLQPHSDPYWSQRSFDEITTFVNSSEFNINEVQIAALTGFNTPGQQFTLSYNGQESAPIVRGSNYTAAGVKAAIEAIPGWPAGGTVSVTTVGDTSFTVTFSGTLGGTNTSSLGFASCSASCTAFIGEVAKGGLTTRGGILQTATGNAAPVVAALPSYTIPVRTPFALTGTATDPNGDPLTYMWEQTDRGATSGTALTNNVKTNGPLFSQFGLRADVTPANSLIYNSPGQNMTGTNPTRVFPDMVQIAANETNAEALCTTLTGLAQLNCFSEHLPTPEYVGFSGVNASPARLNFKFTVRDGKGGVNSESTSLVLAPSAGPFLVTYPNAPVALPSESLQTVTWNVANTNVAPVNAANVRISMSVDGGLTYPLILAAVVPNTGSRSVFLPQVGTTQARIKVEAVDNVFFDVSNANFTVRLVADVNGDGVITCADFFAVTAALGTSVGQPGFLPAADTNGNGRIDARDVSYVQQRLPQRVCTPTAIAGR